MKTQKVYLIFWQPAGYSYPGGYVNTIEQFAQDVAADAGKTSNSYGAITQYGVAYKFAYGGSVTSVDPFPGNDCPTGGGTICITDQDVINEIASVQSANGWTGGLINQFALILPPNVDTCFDSTSDSCSYNQFCAYHSWYVYNGSSTPYVYLNLPYEVQFASACHTTDGSTVQPEPNGGADVLISPLSHEERESATDPTQHGWYDADGNEADDKCFITWGPNIGETGGSVGYNQLVNGHPYEAQNEWSNALHGCYQVGPPTVTSLSATSGLVGSTIGISGTNFFAQYGSTPTVTFPGATSPTVLVDSPTHLTVTVPAGVHVGKVTVQALGGTATSTQSFGPAPTITSLTNTLGDPESDDGTGTTLVVHGTGFFGVTSVKFNAVVASFKTVATDGTSLQVVVPPTAATGEITVTTSAGGVSNQEAFTVSPKITSFTPTAAKGLSNIKITGTGLAGTTEVDFNGDPSPQIGTNTATTVVAQVPDDATAGTVTVGNGTDSATSTASFKPLPFISGISPVDGGVGTVVTIAGGELADATEVKFGTISEPPATHTATQLTADVPAGFLTGKITVVTPEGTAISSQTFAVTTVKSITPTLAAAGATVTINGQGLGDALSVDFANHTGVIPSVRTATSLKVVVPSDAVDGPLTVHMPDGDALTTATFKPLPRITSVDQGTYLAGDTVTGTNLQVAGPSTAKLGAAAVTPTAITPTSFQFQVPDSGVTGAVSFKDAAGTTTSSANLVHVLPTIIGDPVPNNGKAGDHIVLTGKTFTGTTSVKFGTDTHAAAFVVSNGGQTLTVTVPATGDGGQVTVTNAGGSSQTVHNFSVIPVIKSFTPISTQVGGTVTITGTGFTDADSVKFGDSGLAASPTNVTATSLKVVVPAGATTDHLKVHTLWGTSDPTSTNLTITFSLESSTGAAPYDGTVTLTGLGFSTGGAVSAVKFNGVNAASFTVNSDTQITATVPHTGAVEGTITITKGTSTISSPVPFWLLTLTSLSDPGGPVGSQIEINGSAFTYASGVTFNGVSAPSFTIATFNKITATVPAGATSGVVTVTTPGGSVSSTSFNVENLAGVYINEVRTDASGFIELYNSGDTNLDLNGATLVFRPAGATDASTDVVLKTFGQGAMFTNGFEVFNVTTLNTTGGGLALELPDGMIVDHMGYGTATNAFVRGTPIAAPAAGHSVGRSPDGEITAQDDSVDFVDYSRPPPGPGNP